MGAPLTVELWRGPHVESRHTVHGVVTDIAGAVVRSWGDPDRLTHPRSSVKPLQALPLVETGAADAFELGAVELALACASHDGEPGHVAAVEDWLARIGCTASCNGWTYFNFRNLTEGTYEVRVTRNGDPASETRFEVS